MSFLRHRRLLLTLYVLAMFWLTGASTVLGAQQRHMPAAHGEAAAVMAAASDRQAEADAGYAVAGTSADDTDSDGQQGSDGGVDDQMVVPGSVQLPLTRLRSSMPAGGAAMLPPAPSFGPLRPPRAA
jgi:hypothetical protein